MTKQIEESVASETLKPQNKSEMLGAALAKLAGLSIEDLSHYLNDTLAQVSDSNSSLNGGGAPNASSSNQASLNMKPSAASSAMKESVAADVQAILAEGEDLSEEVKTQVASLFEAALDARIIIEREELIEEMNEKLDEAFDSIQTEMAEKLDTYLDALVETWLADNEVAIESALRNEVTEDFVNGLKNLFSEHYMNLPEEKVEVVEELADIAVDLEARLDEALTENAALKKTILESDKHDVIDSVCEGLALTQAEKLRSLCENVEFDGDLDAYKQRIVLVKENLNAKSSSKAPASTGILTEESDPDAAQNGTAGPVLDPMVQRYKDAISRGVRK